MAIRGAFDQDCSLYTRVGDPDRHLPLSRPRFFTPAVGRTLVSPSLPFFPYSARHDRQCRMQTTNSNRNPNDDRGFFFSSEEPAEARSSRFFLVPECNKVSVMHSWSITTQACVEDRTSRGWSDERLPLADASHPSRAAERVPVDPTRETPRPTVAHKDGWQVSRRLVVSPVVTRLLLGPWVGGFVCLFPWMAPG